MELTTTTAPPREKSEGEAQVNRFGKIAGRIGKRPGWLAFLFFGLTSLVFTWPLVTDLSGSLFDRTDATDTAWRMGAIAHQLLNDPFHLYNSNTFYPVTQNLQLDELVVGDGLLFAPVVWLSNNPVLAYNLLILSSFALSGFAMWLLVRHLTGSVGAGLVAGLIYAYSPWHEAQFAHGGLGAQEWMVFALYFLILFTEQPKALARRSLLYLGLFIVCLDLQILCAGYYAYFTAILCGFYLLYYFLTRFPFSPRLGTGALRLSLTRFWPRRKTERKLEPQPADDIFDSTEAKTNLNDSDVNASEITHHSSVAAPAQPKGYITHHFLPQFGLLLIAGIIALLILLPFIKPYIDAQQEYGFKRDIAETRYWSAAPPSLLRTVQRSWLYKPVERGILKAQSSGERVMYPGLIVLGLAFVGLFLGGKKGRGLRWTFGLLALVALLLSFGPYFNVDEFGDRFQPEQGNFPLPYLWLYNNIPGFDSLRVPHRFAQLVMLALAVCAGYGVAKIQGSKFKVQSSRLGRLSSSFTHRATLRPEGQSLKLGTRNPKPETRNSNLKAFAVPGIFGLLVAVEFFAPGLPQVATPMGQTAPAMYRWLADKTSVAQVPKDALVLELPVNGPPVPINSNPEYALYGLMHGRPMLNGTANILPPGYERLFNEIKDFPEVRSLDVVEGLGVKFLLVHRDNPTLTPAAQETLGKLAQPEGRLEVVKEFGTDIIYKVKPGGRFDKLTKLIGPGSEIFLGDDTNHKSLYPMALVGLLGPSNHYFSAYRTVYNPSVQAAQPNRVYDYAIFYQKTAPTPYGYQPSDLIWQNEVVQVYHKQKGLETFFSFEEQNSGHYLAFNEANPARLSISTDKVSRIADERAIATTPPNQKNNRAIALLVATPVAQTLIIRTPTDERKVQLSAGFYRYRLNLDLPGALELRTEGLSTAYLLQVRTYSNTMPTNELPERLSGKGGVILQAETLPKEGEPSGVVVNRLLYYTDAEKPAISLPPTLTLQLTISNRFKPAGDAQTTDRQFGEWAVQMPLPQVDKLQILEMELDLTAQQGQASVNNDLARLYSMPLSSADGNYLANLSFVPGQPGLPQANAPNRPLNTFSFRLSHNNGQIVISNLRLPPPAAFIVLPSGN